MKTVKTRGVNVSETLERLAEFSANLAEAEAAERDWGAPDPQELLLVDPSAVSEVPTPNVAHLVHTMLDGQIGEEGWNVSTYLAEMRERGEDMRQVINGLLLHELEGGWSIGDAVAMMVNRECGLDVDQALTALLAAMEDSQ